MKQVTTREIQQHTRSVRQRLESGETLQWTIRGRVVARLTPVAEVGDGSEWTDPLDRLQTLYGDSSGSGTSSASEQIYRDRG